jgi:uncharacterized RDD family membrane protein YckC
MTAHQTCLAVVCAAALVAVPGAARAQAVPAPSQAADAAPAVERQRAVVRMGQGYALDAGRVAEEIVVIGGDVRVDGHVEGDVVVVLGGAHVGPTAVVDGDLVIVAGDGTIADGASVGGDLVVTAGSLDAPASFAPGGEHVIIGTPGFGPVWRAVAPWITRGLMWGRPIVPDLGWIWLVVAFVFVVYASLNLVFDRPVRACADTLAERPLTAFLTGLLVMLLVSPLSLLLVMSVVGVFVVPFLYCAVAFAWVIGRIAVARAVGMTMASEGSDGSRLLAFRAFAIGSAAIVLAYMVPALGFVAWALIGVFGLGAAALALAARYRQEHPAAALDAAVPRSGPVISASPAGGHEASLPVSSSALDAAADLASFPRASFSQRLGAFVLDIVLVGIVTHLLGPVTRGSGHAFQLLLLVYHIGFWAWKGTTVGGIICRLRVVRTNGLPLGFGDAVVRGLSSIFSIAVLGLGCFWILRDPERQAWHDRIAGTYVVTVPRNWPL